MRVKSTAEPKENTKHTHTRAEYTVLAIRFSKNIYGIKKINHMSAIRNKLYLLDFLYHNYKFARATKILSTFASEWGHDGAGNWAREKGLARYMTMMGANTS